MLAAVLIVSLVFGLLLESVTRNLADLGRARLEARATQLAELRAREIEQEIAAAAGTGTQLESGIQEGAFEEPDADLRWHITVSEQTLALPDDYPGKQSPSPLFAAAGATPPVPVQGQVPPLRLVEVRVFPVDTDPEAADPFVLLVTAPPDPARLQQLEQQRQQNPQETDREQGRQPEDLPQ